MSANPDMHMEDEEPPLLLENDEAGPSQPRPSSHSTEKGDIYDRRKVPITLLTGYLGAGKSTLLEYVLTAQHGYRIAVCMNDFGDTTDIEARTLTLSNSKTNTDNDEDSKPNSTSAADTTTSFLSLPNGCLCCSVKDLGIAAIEDMVANAPGGVDWVMVELTGVADPGPIVRTFWSNEEMGDLVLDGVVCVVDSRNVLKQLGESRPEGEINECQKQIACADVVLLNKIDLVSSDHLSKVEGTIRNINPTIRTYPTDHSRAPLEKMFNIRAFTDSAGSALRDVSVSASIPSLPSTPDIDIHSCSDPSCAHDHDHAHSHSKISTVLLDLPPLSKDQYDSLNTFLETLLWEGKYPVSSKEEVQVSAPEILRTKGYIILDLKTNTNEEYILQGVQDIFELKQLPTAAAAAAAIEEEQEGDDKKGKRMGKIVFIGKSVDEDLVRRLKDYLQI